MKHMITPLLSAALISMLFSCSTFRPPLQPEPADLVPEGFIWGGYDADGTASDDWFYDFYRFFEAGEPPHPYDYGGYYDGGIFDDESMYDFYEPPGP